MKELACCTDPKWLPDRDLDSAGGFDFMLGRCRGCGASWMNVFCTASGMAGYEPVAANDAAKMRSIQDPRELKRFMRDWGDTHL